MKLLELMVQEQVQWPDDALWAVQDFDRELKFDEMDEPPSCPVHSCSGEVWYRGGHLSFDSLYLPVRASDWDTKAVSKQEYDAAMAKEACESVVENALSSTRQWYIDLAHVIAAAAEGKVVQYLAADGNWYDGSGAFVSPNKYRVKPEAPKTIKVNGFDVPEPMREAPVLGASYFIAAPHARDYYHWYSWDGIPLETYWLLRGLLYSTEEAAVAHAKAMLGIDPYTDEGADDEHS